VELSLTGTGAAIEAAQVRAIEDATGSVTEARTAKDGTYLLNFLLPGTYRIEVIKSGFQQENTSGVVVECGRQPTHLMCH